jgi:Adenylate and Guanylate cyclase catalytic domain
MQDSKLNPTFFLFFFVFFSFQDFYDAYNTSTPALITLAVAAVSLFTIVIFLMYDYLVEKRQTKVLNQAAASTMIVSSLFPKSIQDRLMQQQEENSKRKKGGLKSLLNDDDINKAGGAAANSGQMADFFPYCTVLFADIAGFTAWSSTREPSQVFDLLQTIFQGFDSIAKKRKVFKVETIGDCYVAVTGLPDPQAHHALIMSRFAAECKHKMRKMTRDLEVSLGPDTADLCLRIGLHSG